MSGSSKRMRRMADLIQREVALIIRQNVVDPRLQKMVVTLVEMSPDLKSASIFFTIHDDVLVDECKTRIIFSPQDSTQEDNYTSRLAFNFVTTSVGFNN